MGKPLKILVACEESQVVCKAFRERGHEAYSCDIQECSGGKPEWHIRGDAITAILSKQWDMVIAHPPCTYLCNSGARWLKGNPERFRKMLDAVQFFINIEVHCVDRNIPICIENPVPHKHAVMPFGEHRGIGKYTQIIHPWQYGHMEQKSTCLWLYGLPKLKETHNVHSEMMNLPKSERNKVHRMPPGANRSKLRSKTYPGIANAMASQWSDDLGFTNEETFLR